MCFLIVIPPSSSYLLPLFFIEGYILAFEVREYYWLWGYSLQCVLALKGIGW